MHGVTVAGHGGGEEATTLACEGPTMEEKGALMMACHG